MKYIVRVLHYRDYRIESENEESAKFDALKKAHNDCGDAFVDTNLEFDPDFIDLELEAKIIEEKDLAPGLKARVEAAEKSGNWTVSYFPDHPKEMK